ncbi:MAG: SDR family oxidoreductase [Geminicoccaceae bacterium]|nr:SDR family oxidoreductase [Geminicoccaceae bacterium]
MHVLITGGGGFIGRKLAARLLRDGQVNGREISRLTVVDVVEASGLGDDPRLVTRSLDVSDRSAVDRLVGGGVDLVYHLAAIVSANAETDMDLGYRVNLDGTRNLLEALRTLGTCPKIVFASSCAVYGGDMPPVIEDDTHLTPQTSYGAQKAAGELLVADYVRKGLVDGMSLRLPTIVVRPGKPNKAASTFASSILREPLAGQDAVCPVGLDAEMYVLSPRRVVDAFVHAAGLERDRVGMTRAFALPGITVSIGQMIEALEKRTGPAVTARIHHERDELIERIVKGWAPRVNARHARSLGFEADADIGDIIEAHIEDELGGTYVA